MELLEARELAAKLKGVKHVRVVGYRSKLEALVITIREREVAIREGDNALGKIAKASGVHGHVFATLNICGECYHRLRAESDGHYHERMVEYGKTSATAEPVCCRCKGCDGKAKGASVYVSGVQAPPATQRQERRGEEQREPRATRTRAGSGSATAPSRGSDEEKREAKRERARRRRLAAGKER